MADESKMVDCVMTLAVSHVIETPVIAIYSHPINQDGFFCQDFFTPASRCHVDLHQSRYRFDGVGVGPR
jgi:hypothetical protein